MYVPGIINTCVVYIYWKENFKFHTTFFNKVFWHVSFYIFGILSSVLPFWWKFYEIMLLVIECYQIISGYTFMNYTDNALLLPVS